jgi:hypothetical protein
LLRKQYEESASASVDVGNILKSLSQSRGSRQKIVRKPGLALTSSGPKTTEPIANPTASELPETLGTDATVASTVAIDTTQQLSEREEGTEGDGKSPETGVEKSHENINISFFALSNELSELANSKEKKGGNWRKELLSMKMDETEEREPTGETKNIIGRRRGSMRSLGMLSVYSL